MVGLWPSGGTLYAEPLFRRVTRSVHRNTSTVRSDFKITGEAAASECPAETPLMFRLWHECGKVLYSGIWFCLHFYMINKSEQLICQTLRCLRLTSHRLGQNSANKVRILDLLKVHSRGTTLPAETFLSTVAPSPSMTSFSSMVHGTNPTYYPSPPPPPPPHPLTPSSRPRPHLQSPSSPPTPSPSSPPPSSPSPHPRPS